MTKALKVFATAILWTFISLAISPTAHAAGTPQPCVDGTLPSGALSRICIPLGWNGQLLVFAHGYVAPGPTLGFHNLTLADGTSLPDVAQLLGFAFATTSYRRNGLAILEGADDIRELVARFAQDYSVPLRTYIAGASEGGLVTALLAEQSPDVFFGALSTCGPIGSLQAQINYFDNFRVLFDYFFPGVIPGSPINIPPAVMANWDTLQQIIIAKLAAHPARALELMRTSRAAYDPADPKTIAQTTLETLWYNVFATNDAVKQLGGNAFDNRLTPYFGSSNDLLLNLKVQRFSASPTARAALKEYATSGQLSIPMVTVHTTGDDVVPFWHELLYWLKFSPAGRGQFLPIPVARYGHCSFTGQEVLAAFGVLAAQP
jgi:pimeloyl-ACP methyl ester carboxylesterase